MRGGLGRHLRRNAVAYLALFVALGGTGYAASRIPHNSVGTQQLRNGAVTLDKVRPTTQKALRGQTGAAGPRGPVGAPGAAGVPGVVASAHIATDGTIVSGSSRNISADQVFKKAATTGIYCFRGLNFSPRTAIAISDGTGKGALAIVTLDHSFKAAECPNPYDVEVQMLVPWIASTLVDSGFFIQFS